MQLITNILGHCTSKNGIVKVDNDWSKFKGPSNLQRNNYWIEEGQSNLLCTVTPIVPGYLGQGHTTEETHSTTATTLPPGVKHHSNSGPAESPPPCTSWRGRGRARGRSTCLYRVRGYGPWPHYWYWLSELVPCREPRTEWAECCSYAGYWLDLNPHPSSVLGYNVCRVIWITLCVNFEK